MCIYESTEFVFISFRTIGICAGLLKKPRSPIVLKMMQFPESIRVYLFAQMALHCSECNSRFTVTSLFFIKMAAILKM